MTAREEVWAAQAAVLSASARLRRAAAVTTDPSHQGWMVHIADQLDVLAASTSGTHVSMELLLTQLAQSVDGGRQPV